MASRIFAKKVTYDGITFDSEMECDYYKLLVERRERGEVENIVCHLPYELQPAFELDGVKHKPITYEPDFIFMDKTLGKIRYVDVKGMLLPEFEIKYKMFEYHTHNHLEVLKYSKTTGWVEYKDYKRIMREKKKAVVIEKNKYKQLYEYQKELDELKKIQDPTKRQVNRMNLLERKMRELNG